MATVTSIASARARRKGRAASPSPPEGREGFEPCSQDMTICGDCEGNRAKMTCPRLREWDAKKR